jgi:hypothetical protein
MEKEKEAEMERSGWQLKSLTQFDFVGVDAIR